MRSYNPVWLDIALAAVLAVVSVVLGLTFGRAEIVALDLAACAAAGLVPRTPRVASAALAVILLGYFAVPADQLAFGEYAALIPILGLGVRGQTRLRTIVSGAYLAILTGLQVHDYPQRPWLWVAGLLIWSALFGGMWLIGNVVTSLREAQRAAQAAALTQQRLELARDLHDTVARSLMRATLQVEQVSSERDVDGVGRVADTIRQAATDLRWMLSVLRAPDRGNAPAGAGSLTGAVDSATASLRAAGFPVTVTTGDADLSDVPEDAGVVLAAILAEGVANIERHGRPGTMCTLIVDRDRGGVQLLLANEISNQPDVASGAKLGLVGAAERLATIGGTITAAREGKRWVLKVNVPLCS